MVKAMAAALVLLTFVGSALTVFSYPGLHGQEVLFNRGDNRPGAASYGATAIAVDLDGKFAPNVTGYAGGLGCCVDFYLVNDTEWNAWVADPATRDTYATVHLNASVVKSQTAAGEFSFVPPSSAGYTVVFVNDNYPNSTDAIVHANVILHYVSLGPLYAMAVGILSVALGLGLIVLTFRAKGTTVNRR